MEEDDRPAKVDSKPSHAQSHDFDMYDPKKHLVTLRASSARQRAEMIRAKLANGWRLPPVPDPEPEPQQRSADLSSALNDVAEDQPQLGGDAETVQRQIIEARVSAESTPDTANAKD